LFARKNLEERLRLEGIGATWRNLARKGATRAGKPTNRAMCHVPQSLLALPHVRPLALPHANANAVAMQIKVCADVGVSFRCGGQYREGCHTRAAPCA